MAKSQSETGFSPPGLQQEHPQSAENSTPSTVDYRSRSDRGTPKKSTVLPEGETLEREGRTGEDEPRRTMAAGATASRSANNMVRKSWADIKEDDETFEGEPWHVPDDEVASRGRRSQTSRSSGPSPEKLQALQKLKADAAKLREEEAEAQRRREAAEEELKYMEAQVAASMSDVSVGNAGKVADVELPVAQECVDSVHTKGDEATKRTSEQLDDPKRDHKSPKKETSTSRSSTDPGIPQQHLNRQLLHQLQEEQSKSSALLQERAQIEQAAGELVQQAVHNAQTHAQQQVAEVRETRNRSFATP